MPIGNSTVSQGVTQSTRSKHCPHTIHAKSLQWYCWGLKGAFLAGRRVKPLFMLQIEHVVYTKGSYNMYILFSKLNYITSEKHRKKTSKSSKSIWFRWFPMHFHDFRCVSDVSDVIRCAMEISMFEKVCRLVSAGDTVPAPPGAKYNSVRLWQKTISVIHCNDLVSHSTHWDSVFLNYTELMRILSIFKKMLGEKIMMCRISFGRLVPVGDSDVVTDGGSLLLRYWLLSRFRGGGHGLGNIRNPGGGGPKNVSALFSPFSQNIILNK